MEQEFYIGQIFEGMYPSDAAIWCNNNHAKIVEIDPEEREVEETYIEMVEVEQEVVIPAEYDEDGNLISEEHTEIQIVEEPQEKTRTVSETVRRFEIQEIPEPSEEEIKARRIAELKEELNSTDYVILKIAETDDADEQAQLREHYADIIANRKAWRDEINELEA